MVNEVLTDNARYYAPRWVTAVIRWTGNASAIAADIGPGLAKAALLAVVDDVEWDLTRPIER